MKKIVLALVYGALLAGCATWFERTVYLTPEGAEIVVAPDGAKVLSFAAEEMNSVLERAFGKRLPVVQAPTPGKTGIYLGASKWSQAAGVTAAGLKRDAFTIAARDGAVYIVGRDDATYDLAEVLRRTGRVGNKERGTLFGVYDFLERYAGVRFYFPGDLGTVVPRTERICVPEGTVTCAPNFTVRDIYIWGDGVAPGATNHLSQSTWKTLEWLRLRMQTESIPCCHGQRGFTFPERFHKTHPEYFALVKRDGKLVRDAAEHQTADCDAQMCHSSGIWDEMFLDCQAYLTGQDAETRGVQRQWGEKGKFAWNANCRGRIIDVMAQDGMVECQCAKCQAVYDKSQKDFATELVWGNTAKLARRLKAAGITDFALTQMAYPPYRSLPKCDLPPEIQVMVAEMGPWGGACPGKTESELEEVRSWTEKLGHRIWMWTYPSKYGRKATPGAPDMAPRAWAAYYKKTVPYSFGAFCECEGEKSIFHYLNYYVFSRIAWDPEVDVEALLTEHFRLMFGAAAGEMAAFYAELETKWTREVLHSWHDGMWGKDFKVASDIDLWRRIYAPEVRARWAALFAAAAKKTANDAAAAQRVAYIRQEFLEYMNAKAERFLAAADPERGRARYAKLVAEGKNLFPTMKGPVHLVNTNAAKVAGHTYSLEGKLKPATRYRLSGVFKLKDVKPNTGKSNEGCWFDGYVGTWQWFPHVGGVFAGSCDWVYQTYELTTPPAGTPCKSKPYLGFVLSRATGEAWIECLSLEEVGSASVR